MGATHKYDLTSDVTHLIVGEVNSPKYKFVARERPDVAVLKPEWIEAVRQSWMKGGDTDIHKLEEQHRLPIFAGLSICITGFEDSEWNLLYAWTLELVLLTGGSGPEELHLQHGWYPRS